MAQLQQQQAPARLHLVARLLENRLGWNLVLFFVSLSQLRLMRRTVDLVRLLLLSPEWLTQPLLLPLLLQNAWSTAVTIVELQIPLEAPHWHRGLEMAALPHATESTAKQSVLLKRFRDEHWSLRSHLLLPLSLLQLLLVLLLQLETSSTEMLTR